KILSASRRKGERMNGSVQIPEHGDDTTRVQASTEIAHSNSVRPQPSLHGSRESIVNVSKQRFLRGGLWLDCFPPPVLRLRCPRPRKANGFGGAQRVDASIWRPLAERVAKAGDLRDTTEIHLFWYASKPFDNSDRGGEDDVMLVLPVVQHSHAQFIGDQCQCARVHLIVCCRKEAARSPQRMRIAARYLAVEQSKILLARPRGIVVVRQERLASEHRGGSIQPRPECRHTECADVDLRQTDALVPKDGHIVIGAS